MSRNFILIFFIIVVGIFGILIFFSSSANPEVTTSQLPTFAVSPTPTTSPAIMNAMKVEDTVIGTGPEVKKGDTVTVHYTGRLENGTKFDSSLDRGTPFSTVIGVGSVIKGWDEGIPGMKVGGKRKLTIPGALAYGEQGIPPKIPPNATLVFEVELLEIK